MDILKISEKESKLFKHSFQGTVQFSEVDSYGVVHNLKYFYWLEWARTDYLKALGVNVNPATFISEHPLMTVHSELDYFSPLKFMDSYIVLSRIEWIKESSLCFENIILSKNGVISAKGKSILVNVNPKKGESTRIEDDLRKLIIDYEKENVILKKDN